MQRWVADLNRTYRKEPALYELDCDHNGFEWIDCNDADQSMLSFLRKAADGNEAILVVLNFTPVPRLGYRVGVPWGGGWKEILNSDAKLYGGADFGNLGRTEAEPTPMHGRPYCVTLTVPPLAAIFLKGTIAERSQD